MTFAACACLGLARMQSTRWLSAKPEDVAPEAGLNGARVKVYRTDRVEGLGLGGVL